MNPADIKPNTFKADWMYVLPSPRGIPRAVILTSVSGCGRYAKVKFSGSGRPRDVKTDDLRWNDVCVNYNGLCRPKTPKSKP